MSQELLYPLIAELAEGLPDEAVERVVTTFLASRCTPDVAELARDHGWKPIVDAGKTGSEFPRDYDYRINITCADDERFYEVNTTFELTRSLPSAEGYVKFGRTAAAISQALDDHDLLAVELVPVSRDDWDSETVRSALSTKVMLGDAKQPQQVGNLEDHGADTYRLAVELPDPAGKDPVTVRVNNRYLVPRSLTYFPVKLANVYLYGKTKCNLEIDDPAVEELEAWVSLPGVSPDPSEPSGSGWKIRVATASPVLVWPGTAVVFVWRRKAN